MHVNNPSYCQVMLTPPAMSTEVVGVGIIWTNGGSVDHRIDTLASVNGEI